MNVFSEKGDRFIFPAPHPEQPEQPLSSLVRPDGHNSFCRAEAYGSYSSTKGRFFFQKAWARSCWSGIPSRLVLLSSRS